MEGVDYRIPKEEHAFMHEERIRRELMISSTCSEEVFFEKKP